jgi:cellulose biosynthesis protein BcsQ
MTGAPSDATASPRRLALATTSGSSAKTTTVCALAAIAAERGNASWSSTPTGSSTPPAGSASTRPSSATGPPCSTCSWTAPGSSTPRWPRRSTVSTCYPPHRRSRTPARLLAGKIGAEQQLRRALDDIDHHYDLILIDCRAGTELPTLAGLVAVDAVVGASQAGMKELRNTLSLETFVNDVADGYGRPVRLAGILPCNVPAHGAACREPLDIAAETFGDLLLPPIRHSVSVTEAHAERRPLTSRARWRAVADDYRAAADALTKRGTLPNKVRA